MDQRTINILSLCSGGGGLDIGAGMALGSARTICWVEWEAFAANYLATCMEAGTIPQAPIWSDLRTFDGRPWRGVVDLVTAGYPCQGFSIAGKRRGEDDPRYLWPHVHRVIGEVEPTLVFLENVPGHLSLGFDKVAGGLEDLGYEVAAGLFTAEEVGAPHKRERLFIVAYAKHLPFSERARCEGWKGGKRPPERSGLEFGGEELDDANGERCEGAVTPGQPAFAEVEQSSLFPPGRDGDWRSVSRKHWPSLTKSDLYRVADGLAADRPRWIRLLGNGVVPLQSAYAFVSLFSSLRGGVCDN